MRTIAAFDFDGTITTSDTFGLFARFAVGNLRYMRAAICCLPRILLWKVGFKDGGYAKEQFFKLLYRGISKTEFSTLGHKFTQIIDSHLRPRTMDLLRQHLDNGDKVYIITASIGDWVRPWANANGIEVLSTEAEVDNKGFLTGKFSTNNCNKIEKVRRLLEAEPERESYKLYAYGDSSGDNFLLDFADEAKRIK